MKKLTTTDDVRALLHATAASAALGAAIKTKLLWMIAETPMDGTAVSQKLNIPGKRGHYWLQYMHSLGILDYGPRGYTTSTVVREAILNTFSWDIWQHLVIDEGEKDACVHGLPQFISEPGSLWSAQGLAEPVHYVDKMRANLERAREFTRMLFKVHQPLASQVAEQVDFTDITRMMDLGGNSGVISMALLRKYPELVSTVVDIENVCIAGREIALEEGLSERIFYHPADFSDDEFPGGFDLVLQCDIGMFTSELIYKIMRSLKPGGRLIYVEHFSPSDDLAPTTRLEWTFLDSLRDPDYGFPTLNQVKERLAIAGFEVVENPFVLKNGLTILQSIKRQGKGT